MAINCILETGLTAFCPFRKVKGQAACPCGVRPRTCDRHGKRPGQPGFPALPPVMLSGAAGAADSIMGSGTSAGGVLRLLQATSPPRSTRMISRATSPPRPCGCVCLVPGPPTERLRPGVRGGGPRDTRRQKFTLRRLSGKSFRQPRIRQLLPIGKIAKALQPERDKELIGRDKGIGSPSPR